MRNFRYLGASVNCMIKFFASCVTENVAVRHFCGLYLSSIDIDTLAQGLVQKFQAQPQISNCLSITTSTSFVL